MMGIEHNRDQCALARRMEDNITLNDVNIKHMTDQTSRVKIDTGIRCTQTLISFLPTPPFEYRVVLVHVLSPVVLRRDVVLVIVSPRQSTCAR